MNKETMVFTVKVTRKHRSGYHVVVKCGTSEFRVYSGKGTVARTIAGVINHFLRDSGMVE